MEGARGAGARGGVPRWRARGRGARGGWALWRSAALPAARQQRGWMVAAVPTRALAPAPQEATVTRSPEEALEMIKVGGVEGGVWGVFWGGRLVCEAACWSKGRGGGTGWGRWTGGGWVWQLRRQGRPPPAALKPAKRCQPPPARPPHPPTHPLAPPGVPVAAGGGRPGAGGAGAALCRAGGGGEPLQQRAARRRPRRLWVRGKRPRAGGCRLEAMQRAGPLGPARPRAG